MPTDSEGNTTTQPRQTLANGVRRRIVRWCVIVLVLYAIWCAVLASFQHRLIFPRDAAGPALPDSAVPREVERVWITAVDGSRVEAWFLRPASAVQGARTGVVVFLHGNAELIDSCQADAQGYLDRGLSVLLPEYRGYGRSSGSPSQSAIAEDMRAFRAWLVARPDIDPTKVVLHGRSLGAAVAAQLAAEAQPAALILESPFISITRMAWGFGVPPFLVSSPFRTDRVLPTLTCPVLILHSENDEIIPFWHALKLHELSPGSTLVRLRGGHNTRQNGTAEYEGAMGAVLERVGTSGR